MGLVLKRLLPHLLGLPRNMSNTCPMPWVPHYIAYSSSWCGVADPFIAMDPVPTEGLTESTVAEPHFDGDSPTGSVFRLRWDGCALWNGGGSLVGR